MNNDIALIHHIPQNFYHQTTKTEQVKPLQHIQTSKVLNHTKYHNRLEIEKERH